MSILFSNRPIWVKMSIYNETDITREQWLEYLDKLENSNLDKQLLSNLYDGTRILSTTFNSLKETIIPILVQLFPSLHYDLQVKM